ncbi:MAG: hypothetical protein AAFR38_01460 [Planctomycetota bacterium]
MIPHRKREIVVLSSLALLWLIVTLFLQSYERASGRAFIEPRIDFIVADSIERGEWPSPTDTEAIDRLVAQLYAAADTAPSPDNVAIYSVGTAAFLIAISVLAVTTPLRSSDPPPSPSGRGPG